MKKNLLFTSLYLFLTLITVFALLALCSYGESVFKPVLGNILTANSKQPSDLLFHLLLSLTVVVATSKVFGNIFLKLKQPAVIGEVIAGIFLGPSFLGLVAPEFQTYLIPEKLTSILNMIAQLGVIIFMFLVGVELDTTLIKKKGRESIAIAHASILFPFTLGAVSAFFLYPRFSSQHVSFSVFTVFMGVSLSVTAFPVLARIIKDLNIARSPMAALTITCASIDDVTAWCLLAFAMSLAQDNVFSVFCTILFSIAFFFIILKMAPWWLDKMTRKNTTPGSEPTAITLIVVSILATALCTEYIGIHALFGPFLLGTMIPSKSPLAETVTKNFESITITLLLPVFFAFTGMRTQINLVHDVEQWFWCLFLITIASFGKIGGASLIAKLVGIRWSDALGIGVLMNTRGLMELIVLNIGLDLKIISPTFFTMMVIMAIATTLMTSPLFSFVTKNSSWQSSG